MPQPGSDFCIITLYSGKLSCLANYPNNRSSVLSCTGVAVTTLRSGHIWRLSIDQYKSTPFNPLLPARIAMESFHIFVAALPQKCSNALEGVEYTLRILRLLRHIQVCSDAIVWRLKLRRRVALISLLLTLNKSVP